MLDSKYEVQGNTWQEYLSAVSVKQLMQNQRGIQFEPEPEADSLLSQIALSVGKDINVPSELSEEEFQLLYVTFNQAKDTIDYLKETLRLNFDITFKERRFWLLDSSDRKLLTGFFHNLIINKENRLGIVIKHYWGKEPPVPITENKELKTLALIATEAFKLKGVVVASLWAFSDKPELHLHTTENLISFKDELQALLKQIQ
jgi:hypothetical protein